MEWINEKNLQYILLTISFTTKYVFCNLNPVHSQIFLHKPQQYVLATIAIFIALNTLVRKINNINKYM
jgi:hypothetical protein